MKKEQVNNALDFLMFSYIGATFSDAQEQILYSAVKRAYKDATMRAALVLKNKELTDENKKDYEKAYKESEKKREAVRFALREEIIEMVVKNIAGKEGGECILKQCLSNNNKKEAFDKWHDPICKRIMEYFNKGYAKKLIAVGENKLGELENNQTYFTYGNAQKLVNMTIKNLYTITVVAGLYKDNERAKEWYDTFSWIIENADVYHIPMDSYIFEIAKVKETWSAMNGERYGTVKKQIDKEIKSLDDEGGKWISKAKESIKSDRKKMIDKCRDLNILQPSNSV